MIRRYSSRLTEIGLTYTQYLVMEVLWEHETLGVSQVGKMLYLDSGTLTPLLKKMESKGFVSRRRSPVDERRVMVSITEAGKNLKKEADKIPELVARDIGLSVEESQDLQNRLTHLLDKIQDSQGE
ncbi:MAG: MarR family winged helix-turn-helix transcriptional regulator [Eggerthellaceae bacterium]